MTNQNDKAEIDRLRVLLRKVTDSAKNRKGFMVEIEPTEKGFGIVVTGYSEDQEWRVAEHIATYMNTLVIGAARWTLAVHGLGQKPGAEAEITDAEAPEPPSELARE